MEKELFSTVWPIFTATLAESNLVVETSKCKAWIPDESDPLPPSDISKGGALEVLHGGLPILATAAGGIHSCFVHLPGNADATAALTKEAQKRLDKATEDAATLVTLVETPACCFQIRRVADARSKSGSSP